MHATHLGAPRSRPNADTKKPGSDAPGLFDYQRFRLPVMPPVAVPAIIRAAVVGVGPGSVIVSGGVIVAVIAIAWSISITIARSISIIRPLPAGDGARGQCAGSQAERQSGAKKPPSPRLSRRGHGGCADGGNRRQNR